MQFDGCFKEIGSDGKMYYCYDISGISCTVNQLKGNDNNKYLSKTYSFTKV